MFDIKYIIKLQRFKKERINKRIIIVEGYREILMALNSKLKLINIIICKSIFIKYKKIYNMPYNKINYIKKKDYKRIVYRKNTEGILAIFKYNIINYNNKIKYILKKSKNNIIIIIDNIEKPGNIGAIIRTVESTSFISCIIIRDYKDIYNSNIIRASLGCVFIYPIIILKFKYIIKYLYNKFYLFGTKITNNNSVSLYNINFCNYNNIAIIFGNENYGISKIWEKFIFKNINIPMYGKINSLNVSISVSIILFEMLRQKKKLSN
ncbi:MAG: RNA methyltransferase [Candidatus Shikimatogenerans bostrichidophilus]|nr:MAG: RNA methyltransferase [Candidatus Shikimatogenerans bostrichidophilus]